MSRNTTTTADDSPKRHKQYKPLNIAKAQANAPAEMKAVRQWVVWKLEDRKGKPQKVPYNPHTGRHGDSTNLATWGTFEEAMSAYQRGGYQGIGFVFANGWAGIDLDNCRNPITGEIAEWAMLIVKRIASYTEISPSLTGLHIFAKAELPKVYKPDKDKHESEGFNNTVNGNKIEIYDWGRFFTFTGEHLETTPRQVCERQAEVVALYDWARSAVEAERKAKQEAKAKSSRPKVYPRASYSSLSDDELINKALNANNGSKFHRLFNGDMSDYADKEHPDGNPSRADMGLVLMLCFWTDDDTQVERLWMQSALYREKSDRRDDYRNRTIERARSYQTARYTPGTDYYEAGEFESQSEDAPEETDLQAIAEGEIDLDDLNYDPPIATDADLDRRTRLALKDHSRVTDLATWLFSSLGVIGDHSKVINSIIAVADGRLVWFQTNQKRLHERGYECLNPDWATSSDKVKSNRVGRDLRAFVDALEAAGLVKKRFRKGKFCECEGFLDYRCGRTGVNSWMRANFLRYIGQAFARVPSIKREQNLNWAWEARKEAALEIALSIPRFEILPTVDDKKIEAEIRAEGQSGHSIMQEEKRQLGKALKRFWLNARNAGFSCEEIDTEMQEEYLNAVSWGLEQENSDSDGINLHVHQFDGHVNEENTAQQSA